MKPEFDLIDVKGASGQVVIELQLRGRPVIIISILSSSARLLAEALLKEATRADGRR